MDRVVIGAGPHKLSVTIEARDNREILRATGQFGTDARSCRQLPGVARQWPERIWAVEGANGIGRPLARRLLASGEQVLDVPAKLAARARVFDTGQGRKTDAADAHAIVMVALRDKGLREVRVNPELMVLRMLCDRRDELSRARNQGLNRLHSGGGIGGCAPPGRQAQGDESRTQGRGPGHRVTLPQPLPETAPPDRRQRGVVEEPPAFPATRRTVASAIRARREPRTECPAMTL